MPAAFCRLILGDLEMSDKNFNHLDNLRSQLTQAKRAFQQNPNPALSNSILRLSRSLRHYSLSRYTVECTDTYGGDANYCWVNRFSVRASSFTGAARIAAKHLGYSSRIRLVGDFGDGRRYNVTGQPVCFFLGWFDSSAPGEDQHYPMLK